MSDDRPDREAYIRELERRLAKLEKTNAVLIRETERRAALDGDAFDLFRAATALEEKVRERTARLEEAKAQLRDSLSLKRATLEATTDGILVVDLAGRMVDYNQRLLGLWRVPPDAVRMRSEVRTNPFIAAQLHDPEDYLRRTEAFYSDPESEGFDVLHLTDGRIFERYSVPQRIGGKAVGRVWSFRDVTEQRKAEQALRDSEARLAQAQRIAQIGNWEIDLRDEGGFWASDETLRLFQIDPERTENPLRAGLDQLDPQDRAEAVQWNAAARNGRTEFTGEWRMTPADGVERVLSVHARTLHDDQGRPRLVAGTCQDITEVRRSEGLNARLGRILDSSSNEIYVFEAETLRFVQINDSALRNLGYDEADLTQTTPAAVHAVADATFREWLRPLIAGRLRELVFEGEHHRRDGSTYPVEVHLQYSPEERPPVVVAVVQDITERRRSHQRLYNLANYDELTGLPNRSLFRDRLSQAIAQARRNSGRVAVLFMDLDRFKSVNDTLGHSIGDQLLQAVAARVQGCLREADTFARQGGDEFTMVLGRITAAHAAGVAEKILQNFAAPFTVGEHEIYTSGSIGITLFPDDAEDADGLLKNADTAMYLAKERGRGTYQFFTPDLNAAARERLLLEGGLRKAAGNGELRLDYQPQVDLRNGAVIGFEALLRWDHPELGALSPDRFIPIAEETGLIIPIGEWVLRQACAQWRQWRDLGLPPMTLAVNMSVRQFRQPELARTVGGILREAGMDPHWLELELTESMLMTNTDISTGILEELKAVGARLAVDDFGTGYSSLNYLKRFPLDTLKIDRSFIKDVEHESDDAEIARGIIALGRALHLTVVAEGVEDAHQREFLLREGCHFAQGYLFGRPVSAAAATEQLRASLPRRRGGSGLT